MFYPLALYIGLRYTRAKKRNHFVSLIALISMFGIALGITILITVLSVMNGFDYEIRNCIFKVARQVTLTGYDSNVQDWREVQKEVAKNKEVIASAPFVFGQAMLVKEGVSQGIGISGILPVEEDKVSSMEDAMQQGSMRDLRSGEFGIVLGQETARNLAASVGDKVVLVTPEATATPIGVAPRFKRFTVVGIFHVSENFGYDATMAFINMTDAQKLFSLGDEVTGLNLKIRELYRAPLVSSELARSISDGYMLSDWTNKYGSYLKAIRMEKTTMFIVLLFIIAVAVFNLVSGLTMTVIDKQSDIAILRTFGATPKTIMSIFMVQGGIIGLSGVVLGVSGGILLALHAPYLVRLLEETFHTNFISAGVYFIDYLPSRLELKDVWQVSVLTLAMSLVATIYPAWRASKTEPATALRYE